VTKKKLAKILSDEFDLPLEIENKMELSMVSEDLQIYKVCNMDVKWKL
jgi:hypothetical protein